MVGGRANDRMEKLVSFQRAIVRYVTQCQIQRFVICSRVQNFMIIIGSINFWQLQCEETYLANVLIVHVHVVLDRPNCCLQ